MKNFIIISCALATAFNALSIAPEQPTPCIPEIVVTPASTTTEHVDDELNAFHRTMNILARWQLQHNPNARYGPYRATLNYIVYKTSTDHSDTPTTTNQ